MQNKTLRVFESFSGIGTQRMALRNLGINHEVVAISEIDKYAIKSYEAIHGKIHNLGDIAKVKIEDIPEHDLFTYSFPCQDISVSGSQKGLEQGSGTRSSLLWECQKVIEGKKPKYLLMENVKNLVGKKFKSFFDEWLEYLSGLGYTNYWKVLNAKDYGTPQNRERVFVVSILGIHEPYEFPEPQTLITRLKDVLEPEVDEKFYLSDERVGKLVFTSRDSLTNVIANGDASSYEQNNRIYNIEKEAPTITARDFKDPKRILEPAINQVAQYDTPTRKNSNRFRTYSAEGISPSLTTMGGGGLEPHVIQKVGNINPSGRGMNRNVFNPEGISPTVTTNKGEGHKILEFPVIAASRGRYSGGGNRPGGGTKQQLEVNENGVSNTLTTVQKDNYVIEDKVIVQMGRGFNKGGKHTVSPTLTSNSWHENNFIKETDFRIRKLTPLECWRLMSISDEDFYKAQEVNSNTQLYKQAGNAIVVSVLEGIFDSLFKEYILEKEVKKVS